MAPKTATKTAGAAPAHASYKDMIKIAILALKDRTGSSRQAIKKYVRINNDLGSTTDAAFDRHIASALNHGEKAGEFQRPKGPSGPVKLAKKDAAKKEVAPKTTATKSASEKTKAAKPKATATKKAAPKKSATASAATKKAAPKKTTTTKANIGKKAATKKAAPKKAPAAPAVVDIKPTALTKTKSGRVQKTTKPVAKAAPKKTTTKKAAPKKAAAKA